MHRFIATAGLALNSALCLAFGLYAAVVRESIGWSLLCLLGVMLFSSGCIAVADAWKE